jgi:hypothetical protein
MHLAQLLHPLGLGQYYKIIKTRLPDVPRVQGRVPQGALPQREPTPDARLKPRVIGDALDAALKRRSSTEALTAVERARWRSRRWWFQNPKFVVCYLGQIPVSAVLIPVMRVRPDFLDVEFHAAA